VAEVRPSLARNRTRFVRRVEEKVDRVVLMFEKDLV
jgi:hypothetical protein